MQDIYNRTTNPKANHARHLQQDYESKSRSRNTFTTGQQIPKLITQDSYNRTTNPKAGHARQLQQDNRTSNPKAGHARQLKHDDNQSLSWS